MLAVIKAIPPGSRACIGERFLCLFSGSTVWSFARITTDLSSPVSTSKTCNISYIAAFSQWKPTKKSLAVLRTRVKRCFPWEIAGKQAVYANRAGGIPPDLRENFVFCSSSAWLFMNNRAKTSRSRDEKLLDGLLKNSFRVFQQSLISTQ